MKKTHIPRAFCFLMLTLLFFDLQAQSENYVSLQGKQFRLNGEDFFPVTMNYIVNIVHDDNGGYFIAPHDHYRDVSPGYDCTNPADCFQEVVDDLETIRDMGFNSIRLIGLGFGSTRPWNWESLGLDWTTYPAFIAYNSQFNNMEIVPITAPYTNMFDLIESFLDAAESKNLKVQLLTGGGRVDSPTFRAPYLSYLEALGANFSDNQTLYSYDFINEPGYFDTGDYSKAEVCELVDGWHSALKNNSPRHLTTIGLTTSNSVFEWDPGILKLDFLSFHIYSDVFDVVKSEIKWISEACDLPWMIGETGYSASSDTSIEVGYGTLNDQKDFAEETIEMVRDCGGSGYSWWQYSDVGWEPGFGIIHRNNVLKPASTVFSAFDPNIQGGSCSVPSNYYNYYGESIYYVTGIVLDQNFEPIKNAVITGTDSNWENGAKTFSQSNGWFTLYSDSPISIVSASAIGATEKLIYSPTGILNIVLNQFQPQELIFLNNITIPTGQVNNFQAIDVAAVNTIISGNGTTGGDCTMKGEQSVILGAGFKSQKGSRLHVYNAQILPECGAFSNVAKSGNDKPMDINSRNIKRLSHSMDTSGFLIEEVELSNSISVYPNPSRGIFNVVSNDLIEIDKIEVYNNLGRVLFQSNDSSIRKKINISNCSIGTYFLKTYKAGLIYTSMIIIE